MTKQYHIVNQNIVVRSNSKLRLLMILNVDANKVFKSAKVSCSCMSYDYVKSNKSITLNVNISTFPSNFPRDMQEFTSSGKSFTINYKDGTSEVYPITYKVKR